MFDSDDSSDDSSGGMEPLQMMLSSYYGTTAATGGSGEGGGSSGGGGAASGRGGPAVDHSYDIDSSSFSVEEWSNQVMGQERLAELLQKDATMTKEIREIDSSMKMLVHENYNKFIKATDAIRKMSTSISSMEEKIEALQSNMTSISTTAEEVQSAMAPRRQKIEKLVAVGRLMSKLERIFELPLKLNRCIELQAYSIAVREYTATSAVLQRYSHVTSFKKILHEANDIMGRLTAELRGQVALNTITATNLGEYVEILLLLGDEPGALRSAFLTWHSRKLKGFVGQCKRALAEGAPSSDTEGAFTLGPGRRALTALSMDDFVREMNRRFVHEVMNVCTTYAKLFASFESEDSDSLASFATELFASYFELMQLRLLRDVGDASAAEASGGRGRAYRIFGEALQALRIGVRPVHQLLPTAGLDNRAAEVIEKAVRRQVGYAFESLQGLVLARVGGLQEKMQQCEAAGDAGAAAAAAAERERDVEDIEAMSEATPLCTPSPEELSQLCVGLCDDIDGVLVGMRPLVRTGTAILAELGGSFGDLVNGQLQDTIIWINALLADVAVPELVEADTAASRRALVERGASLSPKSRARFLLALALLCRHLEQQGVTQALSTMLENMPPSFVSGGSADGRSDSASPRSGQLGMAAVPELIRRTKETSQKLLLSYVAKQGTRLSKMLRYSIETTDWREVSGGPREVREAYVLVYDEIISIATDSATLFDVRLQQSPLRARKGTALVPDSAKASGSGSAAGSEWGSSASVGLQLDMDKLFAKKLALDEGVKFEVESVMLAVLRVALKTLCEVVRTQTFSKYGFQQLQVDAAFLSAAIAVFVKETKVLDAMLDEVVSSAHERCVDPAPVDQAIAEAIVSSRCQARVDSQRRRDSML